MTPEEKTRITDLRQEGVGYKRLRNKKEVIANIDSIKKDFCETGELKGYGDR